MRQAIPPGLLECAEEPPVPADRQDVGAAANHYLDVARAGRECRSRLARVRGLVQP